MPYAPVCLALICRPSCVTLGLWPANRAERKSCVQYRILTNEIERRMLNREAFLAGQLSSTIETTEESISRLEQAEPAAANS
jgi:hypothetical protein